MVGYENEEDGKEVIGVAEMWLDLKRQKRRESTCNAYKGHIEKHLKPFYGKTLVTKIKIDSVERFISHCQEEGMTVPTIRKILITFQGIMTYACRRRWIYHNPVKEVEKPENNHEYSEKNEKLSILSPTQIRKLIDSTGYYSRKDRETGKEIWKQYSNIERLKYKTLIMTAISTGMREGEVLGLKWNDIIWESNQVEVNRTFNHGKFYPPKSKYSKRKIDMVPQLVKQLKEWKLPCPKTKLDLVFPNGNGNPIDANNLLNRVFYPALKKAKIPRVRFHDLRHTFASILIDQEENPKYIQVQMGHSSIQVTYDIYGHLMRSENQESATKLGNTIFGENWQTGTIVYESRNFQ